MPANEKTRLIVTHVNGLPIVPREFASADDVETFVRENEIEEVQSGDMKASIWNVTALLAVPWH